MEQAQQILEKCKQVLKLAQELYHVDLSRVQVRFDLKGRAAGMAYRRNGVLGMRFNRDMMKREAFDHVLNETVPHEVAHLVCFVNKALGSNHDSGWQRICIALGGTGERTHTEEVVYGKGNTYEYCTDRGHKVRLSDKHHRYIQQGGVLRYRRNMGNVTNQCSYQLVGVSGRTLTTPVVPAVKANMPTVEKLWTTTVQKVIATPVASVQQTPVQPLQRVVAAPAVSGLKPGSKAAQAREIMLQSKREGWDYEACIARMMQVIGYDRQLARATFKANAPRVGIVI